MHVVLFDSKLVQDSGVWAQTFTLVNRHVAFVASLSHGSVFFISIRRNLLSVKSLSWILIIRFYL